MDTAEKKLPLHELHSQAGARFGQFAGWEMPLTYPLGVMKEHLHTREHAGLFDISHMKLVLVTGDEAAEMLSFALPIDAEGMQNGQSRYSLLLNEQAGIIDDLIVTRLLANRFMVVVNAGNAEKDLVELNRRAAKFACSIEPLNRIFLAIQGPKAANILSDAKIAASSLFFMNGVEINENWFISRSGYTGEDGFEIALPMESGADVARLLLRDPRLAWVGLAARDSLRLEAGLCLHGNDISEADNPIEAGLNWAITQNVRDKAQFIGAPALLKAANEGVSRKRVGLMPKAQLPVRHGAEIFDLTGKKVGTVTSGGYGPSVGAPIAMGYVSTTALNERELYTEVRGKKIFMSIEKLPFIHHRYFKG